MAEFQKAERKKAKLRIGISGVSGSGKTWSALEIASGMGGKIAMIDTESGRGELYGEDFEYDVMQINAPFSPEKYIKAIRNAENSDYSVLIIDSLSHAWAGDGGVLDIVTKAGGTYQAGWNKGTPAQNSLVDAIITSKIHIIFTMRSKSDYVMQTVTNKAGKEVQAPKKVGMAPIQRDGLEYECTLYMEINLEHVAHITKDNTKLYDQQYITPDKEMGKNIIDWSNSGKEIPDMKKIHEERILKCQTIEELRIVYKEALDFAKSLPTEKIKQAGGDFFNAKEEIKADIEHKKFLREMDSAPPKDSIDENNPEYAV